MPDWIGQTLNKVQIEKFAGRGGMAEVYLGRHITLNRPVAVKFLHGHLSDDPTLNERFRAEAQAVAGLRHSNIVQVFDYDVADDRPYIVMEAIDGPSLSDYLHALHTGGGRLPLETVARFMTLLASALDYAHTRGIIHRDIKPANVMLRSEQGQPVPLPPRPLTDDAVPVLGDFGVARMVNSASLTASGTITGTPVYMSPEQARGEKVDGRSDIYSLGIMLYEILTGQVPFSGDTPATLILKHLTELPTPPHLLRGELPLRVESVVLKALAKNPDERYASAGQMAADLTQALGASPTSTTDTIREMSETRKAAKPATASRRWPLVFFGAAGCAIVGILLLAAAGFGLFAFRSNLFSGLGGSGMSATLRFQDGAALMDEATLTVTNLPAPSPGTQYEAWLIGGGSELRRSLGALGLSDGAAQIVFTDDKGRNLLADFDAVEITVEPSPDPNPLPSETAILQGRLPPDALAHLRHVLVGWGDTPGNTGFGVGLYQQAEILKATGDALLASFEAADLEGVKRNAEGMANLISGLEGEPYGDIDGDGVTTDPGDGYGLLLNGSHVGYIQGTIDHARLAAEQFDATDSIKMHSEHTQISAENVSEWAVALRSRALEIASARDLASVEGVMREVVSLSGRILDGQDLNGNEQVEPVAGEGGALLAYQHAQYMADITLTAPATARSTKRLSDAKAPPLRPAEFLGVRVAEKTNNPPEVSKPSGGSLYLSLRSSR